jgi:predicted transcriptional regulator
MGAYYTWRNQQRLVGAEKAGFLGWFEGHDQAVAIGPSLPRGTTSSNPMELKKIVEMMA